MTTNLISRGYLSTSGGQVVDANGNAVTLDAIAWYGTEGPSGNTLDGLSSLNPNDAATSAEITSYLTNIVQEGFNTVRIPWSDVNLAASLPLLQGVVAQAAQLGLKIIFDHHDNDGHYSQQANGLWYDAGGGSNGTDGNGDAGTITAAQFQADTITLARAFAGNSTVIGFDLDNEPLIGGNGATETVNWGGGGANDILAMYNTVGSAVEAADPGALVIAEGPQNWTGTLLNGQSGLASEGDLSAVASAPVTLTVDGRSVTGKVLYSAHEYPSTIGGEPTDSGASYIAQMNAAWGYLEANNIAPVWIGEMGASLDNSGSDSGWASALADEQAWAATIVPYLKGEDAAEGGPSVPTGFDWWSSGNFPGGAPEGYNSGPDGSVNTSQEAVVSQLLDASNNAAAYAEGATTTAASSSTSATSTATSTAGSDTAAATTSLAPASTTPTSTTPASTLGTSTSATSTPGTSTGTPPSIAVTDAGTITSIDGATSGTSHANGSTFVLTAPGVVDATLGGSYTAIAFVGMSSITVAGGSQDKTVTADGGTNVFMPGSAQLEVTGGAGADTYIYRPGDGILTIHDFSTAKGDTLVIDPALRSAITESHDSQGGAFLSFGSSTTSGIDITNVAYLPMSDITWKQVGAT